MKMPTLFKMNSQQSTLEYSTLVQVGGQGVCTEPTGDTNTEQYAQLGNNY